MKTTKTLIAFVLLLAAATASAQFVAPGEPTRAIKPRAAEEVLSERGNVLTPATTSRRMERGSPMDLIRRRGNLMESPAEKQAKRAEVARIKAENEAAAMARAARPQQQTIRVIVEEAPRHSRTWRIGGR